MNQFILVILAPVTVGIILWAIQANWKAKIRPCLSNVRNWIAIKLHRRHEETPKEAEERHNREMLESDDPDIWKPWP